MNAQRGKQRGRQNRKDRAVVSGDRRGTSIAVYLRYSSAAQSDGTLEDQERACRAWATAEGLTVEAVYIDRARSAWKHGRAGRVGLDELLTKVEGDRSFGTVLVYDMDRLSRDFVDGYAQILQLHAIGVSVADTKHGVFDQSTLVGAMSTVLSLFGSQEYSEKLSRRVAAACRRIRAGGGHVGRAPYGYRKRKDGDLVHLDLVPEQADTVRRIYALRLAGHSTSEIARAVSDGEKRWRPTPVQRVLENPVYAGFLPRDGAKPLTKGQHTPLVTVANWRATSSSFAKRGRANAVKASPYSGLLVCGQCDGPMIIGSTRRGERIFRCKAHHYDVTACRGSMNVPEKKVTFAIQQWAQALLSDPAVLAELEGERPEPQDRTAEIAALQAQQRRLVDAIADGTAPAVFVEKVRELDGRILELEADGQSADDPGALVALRAVLDGPGPIQSARQAVERVICKPPRTLVITSGAGIVAVDV